MNKKVRQAGKSDYLYKENDNDVIWWVLHIGERGIMEFSFDKKTIYNMFEDYPEKLSIEERQIFDTENPYWASFFRGENEDEVVDDED